MTAQPRRRPVLPVLAGLAVAAVLVFAGGAAAGRATAPDRTPPVCVAALDGWEQFKREVVAFQQRYGAAVQALDVAAANQAGSDFAAWLQREGPKIKRDDASCRAQAGAGRR